jgi:hypothetical protein
MGQFQKICVVQVQGALQLAFIRCRLIPLLNARKPVEMLTVKFIPLLKREKCLFWLRSSTPS